MIHSDCSLFCETSFIVTRTQSGVFQSGSLLRNHLVITSDKSRFFCVFAIDVCETMRWLWKNKYKCKFACRMRINGRVKNTVGDIVDTILKEMVV